MAFERSFEEFKLEQIRQAKNAFDEKSRQTPETDIEATVGNLDQFSYELRKVRGIQIAGANFLQELKRLEIEDPPEDFVVRLAQKILTQQQKAGNPTETPLLVSETPAAEAVEEPEVGPTAPPTQLGEPATVAAPTVSAAPEVEAALAPAADDVAAEPASATLEAQFAPELAKVREIPAPITTHPETGEKLPSAKTLRLDPQNLIATLEGRTEPINLSQQQFNYVQYLFDRPNQWITGPVLAKALFEDPQRTNNVGALLVALRFKFGETSGKPVYLISGRGKGYMLRISLPHEELAEAAETELSVAGIPSDEEATAGAVAELSGEAAPSEETEGASAAVSESTFTIEASTETAERAAPVAPEEETASFPQVEEQEKKEEESLQFGHQEIKGLAQVILQNRQNLAMPLAQADQRRLEEIASIYIAPFETAEPSELKKILRRKLARISENLGDAFDQNEEPSAQFLLAYCIQDSQKLIGFLEED